MNRIFMITVVSVSSLYMQACTQQKDAPEQQTAMHQPAAHTGLMAQSVVIRPPLPGRTTAMGTLVLMNHTDTDNRLIAVTSPISDTIEIHTMLNEDGVMKMRRLENGIAIAKGSAAVLKGGSDHLMLFNTQIPEGAKTVPLTLIFEKGDQIAVQALVDDGTASEEKPDAMDHSSH